MLLKNHGLLEKDRLKIENAENLIALYSSEWGVRILCTPLRAMADNKFNKKKRISPCNRRSNQAEKVLSRKISKVDDPVTKIT